MFGGAPKPLAYSRQYLLIGSLVLVCCVEQCIQGLTTFGIVGKEDLGIGRHVRARALPVKLGRRLDLSPESAPWLPLDLDIMHQGHNIPRLLVG